MAKQEPRSECSNNEHSATITHNDMLNVMSSCILQTLESY